MKGIGGVGLVALFVARFLGYGWLSEGGVEGVKDTPVERAKAEIRQLVSGALPEGLDVPSVGGGSDGPSEARGAPVPPSAGEARQQLAGLAVAQVGSMAGYSREAFPHWSTAVDYGWNVDASCDVRDAALIRDGKRLQIGEYCDVESGRWLDPYTGNAYTDPGDIDIDHVVPLANAWRSGASTWSTPNREAYANDPAVLLSAEDNANQEKGDKGPEAWVPPNGSYDCEYARRWISIKSDWGLAVNPAEKSTLREMLATCRGA